MEENLYRNRKKLGETKLIGSVVVYQSGKMYVIMLQ